MIITSKIRTGGFCVLVDLAFFKQARAEQWLLNGEKDPIRHLSTRAIAEEIERQQQLRAARPFPKERVRRSKAAGDPLADQIEQQYEIADRDRDPRSAWGIACESCGESFPVEIALSTALQSLIRCPECNRVHWLCEDDLEPPG
jgi:hypothetical protein